MDRLGGIESFRFGSSSTSPVGRSESDNDREGETKLKYFQIQLKSWVY